MGSIFTKKNKVYPSNFDDGNERTTNNVQINTNMVYDPLEDDNDYNSEMREAITNRFSQVYVRIVTWNLHGKEPPISEIEKIISLTENERTDIFAIGTQECCNSIPVSFVNPSKEKWEGTLQNYFGPHEFVSLRTIKLVGIHLAIFVRKSLRKHIGDIQLCKIPCGMLKEKLPNKGSVSISFKMFSQKYIFINCHLRHGQRKSKERSGNYQKIVSSLEGFYDCENVFDHFNKIFFFGDLNYRVNGTRKLVDQCLRKSYFRALINNDQLAVAKEEKVAFVEFTEGEIMFKPTYKFDECSDVYDTSEKHRIPSWTDRVLFFEKDSNDVKLNRYDACFETKFSDHRPVYADFEIKIR